MNAMDSLILRTATRFLLPLLLIFSLFVLLRGHDEPGGGFIAGLVAAVAFSLYLFAFDASGTRRLMWMDPRPMLGWGLFIATLSGLPALFQGKAFFTALWWPVHVPGIGSVTLSTPLVFDIGVYMVVIGSVMAIVLALAEAEE
ncbi:Na+/H+ antiporter subunit B [Aquisalimonas asiatica]|uniref:Multisubunit sodium/proton antiporter, MrpB subunit n=1 Tax=Aquisalimonas asiatica TaxID=406100 RepID=A0A1H8SUB9_9GAMM|nr:Na+/H+ antiporter subunit B [Aquisalimonas asiatica]SEO81763.1 multisubunit sodium/proton antiporter, MrpB subunit [Aquisalimonas asiatica]